MRLLVQPGEGTTSLVKAINGARKTVELSLFRFDRREIERALQGAVERGVFVHALVAHTNRGGEKKLRKLEMRLLAVGVSVARTGEDLVRYHDKVMIVDRRVLYVLGFNLTSLDIDRSRSFGIVTEERRLVQEAVKLFEADAKRQEYKPEHEGFVVSPVNARQQLERFIKGAKRSLLIYDLSITDPAMIRALLERAKAGVEIRVIGQVIRRGVKCEVRRLASLRLHTRTIIRDGTAAFVGSQSLRALELDVRREVGIIFRDAEVVSSLTKIFEGDWKSGLQVDEKRKAAADAPQLTEAPVACAPDAPKEVAKAVAGDLASISTALEKSLKRAVTEEASIHVDSATVEQAVQQALKGAVKQAVREVMEQGVEPKAPEET
ncbi:MAG: phospholipase D-like domain-containing protein [Terriglobia bacterium]